MKVWREYSAPLKASPTTIEIISADKVEIQAFSAKAMHSREIAQGS